MKHEYGERAMYFATHHNFRWDEVVALTRQPLHLPLLLPVPVLTSFLIRSTAGGLQISTCDVTQHESSEMDDEG